MPLDPRQDIGVKLDEIIVHLKHLDRRDRIRTWASFGGWLVHLIPLAIFVAGAWYAYTHADELMKKIISESAKQSAAVMEQGSESLIDQLRQYLPE